MDWIQCFITYIAVVSCAKPKCVTDLMTYWNLIINSQRCFRTLTGYYMTAHSDKCCNNIYPTMGHHRRHTMESVMFKLQYQTIHIPRRMKNSKRSNDNHNIVAAMMQVVPNFPAPVTATWPRKNISKAYCC